MKTIQGKRAIQTKRRKRIPSAGIVVVAIVVLLVCAAMAANKFGMLRASDGDQQEETPAAAVVPVEEDETVNTTSQENEPAQESGVSAARIKVCLDAGHGGKDPGTNTESRMEKDDVLKLAQATKEAMEAKGIEVIMTRSDDTFVELHDRCIIANEAAADYFISLHRNSYVDSSVSGIEMWKSSNASEEASQLADNVSARLEEAGVQNNRGVYEGSQSHTGDYLVLRETAMPCVLVEMGFVTNEKDNDLFDSNQEAYAEALAQAILDTYEANHGEES